MAEWREAAQRVSNWGRWGPNDELGTLNFITPEKIRQAAGCAKVGRVIPLGIPLDAYGPWGGGYRRNPLHVMTVVNAGDETASHLTGHPGEVESRLVDDIAGGPLRFNDDFIMMHLQAGSQWDAFSHVYYEGFMYNGVPAAAVTTFGATQHGIEHVARAGGIVSRGVLLDAAKSAGVPYLQPGAVIFPDDLERIAEEEKITIEPGDVVVVRTGWWGRFLETRDGDEYRRHWPGLSWTCAEWLHKHQVAAVASDNLAVETSTQETEVRAVLHMLALRDMGMMLGEIWDLEALSRDCAEDGVYEFQLVAQPLEITAAVGSPVHPLAIK